MEHRPPPAGFETRASASAHGFTASVHGPVDAALPPAVPEAPRPDPATILVVDDQEDVRRMLATALAIEGHVVDEADSAVEGLHRLERGSYRLVLSDYAMPGRTGAWMLKEATRMGLLDHTAAVIITAHPEIERVPGVVVIAKPLDLDDFLDQLRQLLASGANP